MLTLLTSFALAGSTRLLADEQAVIAWMEEGARTARTQLPVVGPDSMTDVEDRIRGDLYFVHIPASVDPDAAAIDARLERGSPCALVLAPAEDGWIGWTSGVCGMLSAGGWRVEGQRVLDGTGRPVQVPTFASAAGDRDVFQTYRRLERARGAAIWTGMIGSGVLFASTLDQSANPGRPSSRALQIGSGAVTLGAAIAFAVIQSKPTARPHRIGAHYTPEEMLERVKAHNRRLEIAVLPTGIAGRFR